MIIKLKDYKIYKNLILKFIGLRFSKKSKRVLILDFFNESRLNSVIDTIFVFYPIYVLWLDNKKKVVDIRYVIPFLPFVMPKKKARYVVEFSYKPKIKECDVLKF
mgnify:CR=1 FL=1